MKMPLVVLFLIALFSASANPEAKKRPNYVLVSKGYTIVPLVEVQGGVFEGLVLKNAAPEVRSTGTHSSYDNNNSLGMNGITMFGYMHGRLVGKGEVVAYRDSDLDNGIEEEVTIERGDDLPPDAARIFTSEPLPVAIRNPPRKATQAEIESTGF